MNAHALIAMVGLVSASASAGRVATIHFGADRTIADIGETIVWTVSASWSGLYSPQPYFANLYGDFVANDRGVGLAGEFEHLFGFTAGVESADGANIIWVNLYQSELLGSVDRSNPIDIYRFNVEVGSASTHLLWYDFDGVMNMGVHWWLDPPGSIEYGWTSDSVRIVPAPGAVGCVLAWVIAARRRR